MALVRHVLWIGLLVAGAALAVEPVSPSTSHANGPVDSLVPPGAEGYWFYLNPPELPPPPAPLREPPQPKPAPGKPDPCKQMETWTPACGFVQPQSFAMQAKERDALLQNMVMQPGNPDSVMAVQKYTAWILHQSIYAARVWQYNRLKDPEHLDPDAASPISAFGLQLAMDVQATNRKRVWSAIKQFGGILIVFTKIDCDYCHAQAGPLRALGQDTGLDVWNASLKGDCLSEYKDHCVRQAQSTMPARILHVSTVPTVFLYLPKNVWIRVSAGLTDTQTIEDRTYNLFISWKAAATKAARETGDTGLSLDPSALPRDSEALRKLLMTPVSTTSAVRP